MLKNQRLRNLVIGCIIMLIPLTWIYVEKKFSPNANDAKLREVADTWATVPVYPGWVERSNHTTSKASVASLSKYFASDAPYNDVKTFYVRELLQNGWEYEGESHFKDWGTDYGGRSIAFRRGEYHISVSYAGERTGKGDQYSCDVTWEK